MNDVKNEDILKDKQDHDRMSWMEELRMTPVYQVFINGTFLCFTNFFVFLNFFDFFLRFSIFLEIFKIFHFFGFFRIFRTF